MEFWRWFEPKNTRSMDSKIVWLSKCNTSLRNSTGARFGLCWTFKCPGMRRRVGWWILTDVSEVDLKGDARMTARPWRWTAVFRNACNDTYKSSCRSVIPFFRRCWRKSEIWGKYMNFYHSENNEASRIEKSTNSGNCQLVFFTIAHAVGRCLWGDKLSWSLSCT